MENVYRKFLKHLFFKWDICYQAQEVPTQLLLERFLVKKLETSWTYADVFPYKSVDNLSDFLTLLGLINFHLPAVTNLGRDIFQFHLQLQFDGRLRILTFSHFIFAFSLLNLKYLSALRVC